MNLQNLTDPELKQLVADAQREQLKRKEIFKESRTFTEEEIVRLAGHLLTEAQLRLLGVDKNKSLQETKI